MSVTTPTYRLKPQSGDSTPHDETATGADLSGGTISLVDTGGGLYGWRFSGSASTAAIVSRVLNFATTGEGVTVAARFRWNTNPTSADARLLAYGQTTDPTANSLSFLRRGSGAADRYASMRNGGSVTFLRLPAATDIAAGSGIMTFVSRIKASSVASSDAHDLWWSGGGAGPGSDYNATTGVADSYTLDTLVVAPSGGEIDIIDLLIWSEELSDADCDAVRDDIRAAVDGSGSPVGGLAFGKLTNGILSGRLFA